MIGQVFPDSDRCPDCSGFIFRPGPTAGLCENIECVRCGSRFNVARFDPALVDRQGPMPVVWAHRIPSEREGGGAWREDMFPKVLQ